MSTGIGTSCKVVTAQPRPYVKVYYSGKKRAAKGTVARVLRATSVAQRSETTSSKAGAVASCAKSTCCKAATTIRPHDGEGDFDASCVLPVSFSHLLLVAIIPVE